MRLVQRIVDQFARPHGPVAPLMGRLLNRVNRNLNRAAIDALRLRPGETVLDIGFGGGVGLRYALGLVGDSGGAIGLELSEELVGRVRQQLGAEVASGRLELLSGSVEAIPLDDDRVDGVYTVNTVYFWPDVSGGLGEIARVLAPGGRCVLAIDRRAMKANERFGGYRTPPIQDLQQLMRGVGFTSVELVEPRRGVILLTGSQATR